MTNIPKRKENRLKEYDYSQNGAYFVTVCIEKRKQILSKIAKSTVGDGLPVPQLTEYGIIIDKFIKDINIKYKTVKIDNYIIMPNHIHMLVVIENNGDGKPVPYIRHNNWLV